MRLLAANISDEGRGEYFSLSSKDRARAGVPEAAQRAVEELVYEEALSRLHPTTIGRPVAVCDTCAMVRKYSETKKQHRSLYLMETHVEKQGVGGGGGFVLTVGAKRKTCRDEGIA